MKTNLITVCLVAIIFLASCQPAAPTSLPTAAGQMETQAAATLSAHQTATAAANAANQTSTAAAPQSVFKVALTADALTAAVRTPIPTAAIFHVSVPASACWMSSEVNVSSGQKIKISASGTVNTYGGREGSNSDPNGQKSICGAIQCPVQGAGYGALIGRLEEGKTFFVGTNLEFVATRAGQLYFTVNDWECQDNSGSFDLTITVN